MATYLVSREGADEGELPRIVDCRTKQQAIAHVSQDMFAATPISTKEAMAWAGQGVELEEPGKASEATASEE